jgi:hypothetical protein
MHCRYDEAEALASRVLGKEPASRQALQLRGEARLKQSKPRIAMLDLSAALPLANGADERNETARLLEAAEAAAGAEVVILPCWNACIVGVLLHVLDCCKDSTSFYEKARCTCIRVLHVVHTGHELFVSILCCANYYVTAHRAMIPYTNLLLLLLLLLYQTLQAEQDPRARGLELLREGRAREAVTCLEWSRTKLKAANSPLYPACLLDLALACMKVCWCTKISTCMNQQRHTCIWLFLVTSSMFEDVYHCL